MRQIDCPNGCGVRNTYPMPETAWLRWCTVCDATWDIRPKEEREDEGLQDAGWPFGEVIAEADERMGLR